MKNLVKNAITLSFSGLLRLTNFSRPFENIKKVLEKEQKDMVFSKKSKEEEEEYFNLMKFLFTSPDKV